MNLSSESAVDYGGENDDEDEGERTMTMMTMTTTPTKAATMRG